MRTRTAPLAALLALVLSGCGDDATAPVYDADPVADLAVALLSPHSASLTWTSPTVDGGVASSYEIRYRAGSFADADWAGATVVETPPLPGVPGDPQTFALHNLPGGATLVFRLRFVYDGWHSGSSNPAAVAMPDGEPIPAGFAYVPAGVDTLGSPVDEPGHEADETLHVVTLTRALFVSMHEVTQGEYAAQVGGYPSYFVGDDRPVEQVDWFDAVAYCNARSLSEGLAPAYDVAGETVAWDRDADGYRLPTEAEWEIACRAGTVTAYCNGSAAARGCVDDGVLSQVGVFCVTDVADDNLASGDPDGPDGPAEVGGLLANEWGLFDMHGNVYEWCWDWFGGGTADGSVDPAGPGSGALRVIRGGSWTSPLEACRSAARSAAEPTMSNAGVGLRVVRWADPAAR